MKRRLFRLVVFLVLGAVVNVAVACIGCKSAGSEPQGGEGKRVSRHRGIKCIKAALTGLLPGAGSPAPGNSPGSTCGLGPV